MNTNEAYKKYCEGVDIIIKDWYTEAQQWESEAEQDWSDLKQRYDIKENVTLKDILNESLTEHNYKEPSIRARSSAEEYLGRDIHSNLRYIEEAKLEGGQKFGVEEENITIDVLRRNAGYIGRVIADNLTIKKVRGENSVAIQNESQISSQVFDALSNDLNDIMEERNKKKKKIYGSRSKWEAFLSSQSKAKQDKYGVDHTFVFDLVFSNESNQVMRKDNLMQIMVEEKNVKKENLPDYLIKEFSNLKQWKLKYEKVPFYIYKHKLYTATEMINILASILKQRDTFNKFVIKIGGK